MPAHGRRRTGRRRPGGRGLQHGRPARRPGAPDRPEDHGAGRHHDGGVPRSDVPRGDVARDRRRQFHTTLHGGRHARPARRGRRLHGARVSRSTDDQLRHPRSKDVPADPRRRPRQRGGRLAGCQLEVDGAHQSQGVRGGRLHRVDLQGTPDGPRDQGLRDPRLDDQGHRHRPRRPGRAAGSPRSDRRRAGGGGRASSSSPARSATSRGARPRAFCAGRRPSRAWTVTGATPSRSPSRTSSRSAGSTASRGS